MTAKVICVGLLGLSLLAGCGGGGGSSSEATSAQVVLDIVWSARTRSIIAPSSALSAVVTIPKANLDGTDFTWTINRDTTTTGYSRSYTAPDTAKFGVFTVSVNFYGFADGKGSVVGTATRSVMLETGQSLGTFTTAGTVASVEVLPNQVIPVNQTRDVFYNVTDSLGNVVVVTPGSASFTQIDGAAVLALTSSGGATGKALGSSRVIASVDGVKSQAVAVASAPQYTITDLDTLPGDALSEANGINSSGQVVGYSASSTGANPKAFSWKQGQLTKLNVLPADHLYNAFGVNDSGLIVGNSAIGSDLSAFSSRANANTDLSSIVPNVVSAVGVNNAGSFIGAIHDPPSSTGQAPYKSSAYLYANGSLTRLTTPGTYNYEFKAINQAGVVAGRVSYVEAGSKAFLLENGNVNLLPSGGANNDVRGINGKKEVAGSIEVAGTGMVPAFWTGGQLVTLPCLPRFTTGSANGINANSQLVGWIAGPARWDSLAVTWTGSAVISLEQLIPQDAGWTSLLRANAVNDAGQIVGTGMINGQAHAFLMTPQ